MKAPAPTRRDRLRAMLADLKMPGALEAVDGILSEADGGTISAAEAIEQLLNAQIVLRNNRRLQTAIHSSRLRVLTHPALLVVDEIGYLPVNQDGAVLFFQLINARHERASTVLTSNKGFEDWGGVLGDEVMAAALIDRLVHHCHIVNIRGNSYRMRDHQNLLQADADRSRKRGAS